jgi:3-oxoacyl-[acyl-carrier-protein] synthase-3
MNIEVLPPAGELQLADVLPLVRPAPRLRSLLRIAAMGTYRPQQRLTNHDLALIVEQNEEWILQRTGIRERRVARADEFTSDLCLAAVRDLQRRGGSLETVDYIIVCTTTPDHVFPSVAARLQHLLGLHDVGALDISAACAGFVYGLDLADALVTAGRARSVLVAGAETMTKVVDYRDRTTCVLFGDGAGVALVSAQDGPGGTIARRVNSHGAGGKELILPGIRGEIDGTAVASRYLQQNGRAVYEWAVTTVSRGVAGLLEQAGLGPQDVDWFVPHSANLRMIESICKRTGIPLAKTLTSVEDNGNTSSASIPLALAPAVCDGRIRPGDLVLLYGFGGGLVESALLVRWA